MSDARARFVELMLLFLVMFYCGLAFIALKFGFTEYGAAMLDNNKLVLGGLLGLITGSRLAQRKQDNGNGNGNGVAPH